jgi:hypothetical protein
VEAKVTEAKVNLFLTHNVRMKNCPDAQAMVHQGIIKYSIEGRLVKMDDTQLPHRIPGKGGIKQAIVDDIKRIREESSHQQTTSTVCIINENGHSPFRTHSYVIAAGPFSSAPAVKMNKPNNCHNPMGDKTNQHPKHRMYVDIPPCGSTQDKPTVNQLDPSPENPELVQPVPKNPS